MNVRGSLKLNPSHRKRWAPTGGLKALLLVHESPLDFL